MATRTPTPTTAAVSLLRAAHLPATVAAAFAADPVWRDSLVANPHLTRSQFDALATHPGSATWRARLVWHPQAAGRLAELLEGESRRLPWQAALVAHHDEAARLAVSAGVFSGPAAADLADLVVARFPASPAIAEAALAARPSTVLRHLASWAGMLDDATLLQVLLRLARRVPEHLVVHDTTLRWLCATRPAVARGIALAADPGPLLVAVALAGLDGDLAEVLLDRVSPARRPSTMVVPFVHAAIASSPFVAPELAAEAARRLAVSDRYESFRHLSLATVGMVDDAVTAAELDPALLEVVITKVCARDGAAGSTQVYSWAGAVTAWLVVHLAVRGRLTDQARATVLQYYRSRSPWVRPTVRAAVRAHLAGDPTPAPSPVRPRGALLPECTFGPTPAQWATVAGADADGDLSLGVLTRPLLRKARATGAAFDAQAAVGHRGAADAVAARLGDDVEQWQALLAVVGDLPEATTATEAAAVAAALT